MKPLLALLVVLSLFRGRASELSDGIGFWEVGGVVYPSDARGWYRLDVTVSQIIGHDVLAYERDSTDPIYIKNVRGSDKLIDGDSINVTARAAGTKEYTSVLGANKRVRAYDCGVPATGSQLASARAHWESNYSTMRAEFEKRWKETEASERTVRSNQIAKAKAELAARESKIIANQLKNASNGYEYAQFELGIRYLKGDGVETNRALALHWLKAACTNGSTRATNALAKLQNP